MPLINFEEVVIEYLDTDEKSDLSVPSDNHPLPISLPHPEYDQQSLVILLQVMSKYKLIDNNVGSLIRAIEKKDPIRAFSEVAYLYNDTFIVLSSNILWVRIKGIYRMLVPTSLFYEILFLDHCFLLYANYDRIRATRHHIIQLIFWRTLKRNMAEFCKKCTVCLATKPHNEKSPGLLTPALVAIRPLQ